MLSKTCCSLLSVIGMCISKGDETDKSHGKKSKIQRQVLGNFDRQAVNCMLDKASKRRQQFDAEDLSKFHIIKKELTRRKYDHKEIIALRTWLATNVNTRDYPMANDLIRKRDHNREYVIDLITKEHVMIQKVLTTKCLRQIFAIMMKPIEDGNFSGARKNGMLRFLERTV